MPKLINYMSKPFPTPPNEPALEPFARGIAEMFKDAQTYQRQGPIYIRKVTPEDVGIKLITWIKDPVTGDPKIEGEGVILEMGMFILRNPDPIHSTEKESGVRHIFNEYVCNDMPYMVKNYGQPVLDQLTGEFQLKRKKGQFEAVRITERIFSKFAEQGCVDEEERIHIAVDFSPFVMYGYKGGWLNSNGYAIGEDEMKKNYEPVHGDPSLSALVQYSILSANAASADAGPAVDPDLVIEMKPT